MTAPSDTVFSRNFLQESVAILDRLHTDDVDRVVALLVRTRDRGGRVFFCGSGGGAGHASHAACDFRKLAGLECYSVSDNVSELTARVNDEGWDTAYAAWLARSRLGPDDTLFVFSVGGGNEDAGISVNLVNAMKFASSVGASITGIVGRDGGTVAKLSETCVVIPEVNSSHVTPQTEGLQALLWHLMVSHPDLAVTRGKWETVT
jgi:D-sedoheptulose 7-phosphate isomerase